MSVAGSSGRAGRPTEARTPTGYPPYRGERSRRLLTRAVTTIVAGLLVRLRLEGRENLPPAPYVICFNHLNWIDPIVLHAAMPSSPRIWFFGPQGGRHDARSPEPPDALVGDARALPARQPRPR